MMVDGGDGDGGDENEYDSLCLRMYKYYNDVD